MALAARGPPGSICARWAAIRARLCSVPRAGACAQHGRRRMGPSGAPACSVAPAAAYKPTCQDIAEVIVAKWEEGWTQAQIAGLVYVSVKTVQRILSRYWGGEPLTSGSGPGSRRPYSTCQWSEERKEWVAELLEENADMDLWEIANAASEEFGEMVSEVSVWRYLDEMDWTRKKARACWLSPCASSRF